MVADKSQPWLTNFHEILTKKGAKPYLDMPVRLRFTQRHLIDLQTANKDWLETDSSRESRLRDGDIGLH